MIALATAVWLFVTGTGFAQDNPAAQREKAMETIGDQLKVLVPIARGEAEFDGAKVNEAASTILTQLNRAEGLFPEGSGGGETRALPAIWEKPDEFAAALNRAKEAAAAVAEAGKTNDQAAFQESFKALGASCAGCHRTFRAPES
ncbi:c-type cytochrome [Rhodoligotrophos defluvii]|uniref:c-type cytochrome n=1 Tax=Rhodoligotrophos defluvii TaxID=2561934 RepID=UPI0014854A99|nr:cytochrome c [Rhodoligotrophos defluvii]